MSCRVRLDTQIPGSRQPERMSALGHRRAGAPRQGRSACPSRRHLRRPPVVVLVHGAWHGSWCWAKVVPLLENQGLAVRTVDLPSTGTDEEALGNLDDDVTALTTVLDEIPGTKVLVGHSYGGLPITEAGAGRDDVAHLVYVCAFMLDVGQSLLDAAGGQPMSWWQVSEDGKSITAGRPESVSYSDCAPDEAAAAAARLTPQSMSSCTTPLRAAALADGTRHLCCGRPRPGAAAGGPRDDGDRQGPAAAARRLRALAVPFTAGGASGTDHRHSARVRVCLLAGLTGQARSY